MHWSGLRSNNRSLAIVRVFVLLSTLALFVFSTIFAGCAGGAPRIDGLNYISSFEGGHKYRLGNIDVLLLSGTYKEMGRQYGGLMKDKLNVYADIVDVWVKQPGQAIEWVGKAMIDTTLIYPERFRQIVEGMSETSGLSVKQLSSIDLNYCSAIAAWGDYTGGGPLVVGRNDDIPGLPEGFENYWVFTVYNPSDGSLPCAFLSGVGAVSCDLGYNKNGLMLLADDGSVEGQPSAPDRVFFPIELTQFMFDSSNFQSLEAEVASTLPNMQNIILLADKDKAVSYELAVNNTYKVPPTDVGLVVQTNHFLDPRWGKLPPPSSPTSYQRYSNLVNLAKKNKGKIDPSVMMTMMSTPISEGGVFRPGETALQHVFVPASLELWISIPNCQDWVHVPLKELFNVAD